MRSITISFNNPVKKACIALIFLLLVNSVSFASAGAHSRALAVPNRFNPICSVSNEGGTLTVDLDASRAGLIKTAPQIFFYYMVATVLVEGYSSDDTVNLISETFDGAVFLDTFDWGRLKKRESTFVLPYADDTSEVDLVFSPEKLPGMLFAERLMYAQNKYVWLGEVRKKEEHRKRKMPKFPHIHEEHIRVDKNVNGESKRFSDISVEELTKHKDAGVDMLWMLGAWEESPYAQELNDYWGGKEKQKRIASIFSIPRYEISEKLGGEKEFKDLVERAEKVGIKIMLDIVPNHMAADTPLLKTHPEFFMQPGPNTIMKRKDKAERRVDKNPEDYDCPIFLDPDTGKYFFYGDDPSRKGTPGYTPWTDTVQFNWTNPGMREFMRQQILKVARLTKGGGIRFDQTQLTFRDTIKKNWFHWDVGFDNNYTDKDEFWTKMNRELKRQYPEIVLLSETYEHTGKSTEDMKFDFYYENVFRKSLVGEEGANLQTLKYFLKTIAYSGKFNFLKFLENHDIYERIKDKLGRDAAFAAAVLLYTLPGASLTYHGQERGWYKWTPSANFVDGEKEEDDEETAAFYRIIGTISSSDVFRNGQFKILGAKVMNDGFVNSKEADNVVAFEREGCGEKVIVVVNYANDPVHVVVDVGDGKSLEQFLPAYGWDIVKVKKDKFSRITLEAGKTYSWSDIEDRTVENETMKTSKYPGAPDFDEDKNYDPLFHVDLMKNSKRVDGNERVVMEDTIERALEVIARLKDNTLTEEQIELRLIDVPSLGVPRFKNATLLEDQDIMFGDKKDGKLVLYMTKRFYDEYLKNNPVLLADRISHEYQELFEGATHAEASRSMWKYLDAEAVIPVFLKTCAEVAVKENDLIALAHFEELSKTSHDNDLSGFLMKYLRDIAPAKILKNIKSDRFHVMYNRFKEAIIAKVLRIKKTPKVPVSAPGDKPKAVILFADDIVENLGFLDMKETLSQGFFKDNKILNGGSIMLYGSSENCKFLENIIRDANKRIKTFILGRDPDLIRDEAEEIKIVSGAARRYVRKETSMEHEFVGIIKGRTNESVDLQRVHKEAVVNMPIVVFKGESGIYSFKQALIEIFIRKYKYAKDTSKWFCSLDPVQKLSNQTAKALYQRMLEERVIDTKA